jgi:hypothetical protein
MAGLPRYHRDAIAEFEQLGCPIDAALFGELQDAEAKLGPPESIEKDTSIVEVTPGISVTLSMSSGSRRPGFEQLRDIVTRYRRAWAEHYLSDYLRTRWETEIREAGRLHAQTIAEHGKPPTAKQFARAASLPTNHWFGGDINGLYGALGEKSPVHPERVRLIPVDRRGFALRVFARLGGTPFDWRSVDPSREDNDARAAEQARNTTLGWFGAQSLRVLQLNEAMGRPPELKDFGRPAFEWRSEILADDPLAAWQRFLAAVYAERGLAAQE